MRKSQNSKKLGFLKKAFSLGLSIVLATAPFSANAVDSQQASQDNAAAKNDQGANLSKIMSIISMAQGALSMAQGAQELSCCSTGCNTGSGAQAQGANSAIQGAAQGAANTITPDKNRETIKRFPDSASLDRCKQRMRLPFSFLLPQKVQASGCASAMMAMATGGLMMAMGIMGMMAANKAAKNSGISKLNSANLATQTSGLSGASAQGIKIDPALLRNGQANAVMTDFEKKFGIPRDEFASAIDGGADPRDLLTNAPKNAITAADINKAMASGQSMSDAQKAAAMDGLSGMQKDMASKLGDDSYSSAGGGSRSTSSLKKGLSSLDPLDDIKPVAANADALPLSDDLKAALAAKDQEERMAGVTGQTIFQVVHNKYQEKLNMIYGQGSNSGVANDQGF